MSLFLIVLLVALMIPLAAVILDSQVGRALAARLESRSDPLSERRLATLESEVDRMSRELQRLLEEKRAPEALPPGDTPD
jgi:hypothetical protein